MIFKPDKLITIKVTTYILNYPIESIIEIDGKYGVDDRAMEIFYTRLFKSHFETFMQRIFMKGFEAIRKEQNDTIK